MSEIHEEAREILAFLLWCATDPAAVVRAAERIEAQTETQEVAP